MIPRRTLLATLAGLTLFAHAALCAADSRPAFATPDYVATTELPSLDEASIRQTLHVAAPAAGAARPAGKRDGSSARPFTSILAAREALHAHLRAGTPVRLRIAPGLYREDLRPLLTFRPEDGETVRDTLLVVEGATPGAVVISGSVEKTGAHDFAPATWSPVPDQPGLLVRDWPFEGHVDPGPWIDSYGYALLPGLMQRSEQIWIDDQPLRQVLVEEYRWHDPDGRRGYADRGTGKGGDEKNQPGKLLFTRALASDVASVAPLLAPDSFAVFTDPASPEALRGKVFVRLPEGRSAADLRKIEVGLWKGRPWSPLLAVRGKNNFVLRNLVFQHATTGPLSAAVAINGARNFLIEDCEFSRNVASGLTVSQSSVGILRRVTARDNGSNGFGFGDGSRQILVEDSTIAFNNIRGAWSTWTAWHASGSKSGGVSNITFRRLVSIGNYANGLWFDVYCRDILVEHSLFLGNRRMGVMFELTRPRGGPQVLRDSIAAFNDNTGVYLSMASNSAVTKSLLVGNGGGGNVEGESHHTQLLFKVTPHPQGPKSAEDWERVELHDNLLASADPASGLIDVLHRKAEPLTQFPWVLAVLQSDANTYWTPAPDTAFRRPDGAYTGLEGWRALLAEHEAPGARDAASTWADPGLDPEPRREFTPASESAVSTRARGLGVPLPATLITEYWRRVDTGLYAPPHLVQRGNYD
jgi:hypothetical protein